MDPEEPITLEQIVHELVTTQTLIMERVVELQKNVVEIRDFIVKKDIEILDLEDRITDIETNTITI